MGPKFKPELDEKQKGMQTAIRELNMNPDFSQFSEQQKISGKIPKSDSITIDTSSWWHGTVHRTHWLYPKGGVAS
jgi:hypothetical protein